MNNDSLMRLMSLRHGKTLNRSLANFLISPKKRCRQQSQMLRLSDQEGDDQDSAGESMQSEQSDSQEDSDESQESESGPGESDDR